MDKTNTLVLVLILLGAFIGGCISTPGTTQTQTHGAGNISTPSSSETQTGETSSFTSAVGTAEINGTFSGWLTAPMSVFNDVQRLLEGMNATLYSFKVEVVGRELNASITVYVLKLVSPFVPENFNVTINGRPLNGTMFVPYSNPIPVSIEVGKGRGSVNTTAYLRVKPAMVKQTMGVWDEVKLNDMNGSVILKLDGIDLRVTVRKPGDYLFKALINGTEFPLGELTVG